MNKELERKSRYLSKLTRHDSEGLVMLDNGYIKVSDILKHLSMTKVELELIVSTNDKQRFIFDEHKTHIRANQGHSKGVAPKMIYNVLETSLGVKLYHGTDKLTANLILNDKINSGSREHVHWTKNKTLATKRANQRSYHSKSEAVFIILNIDLYLQEGNKIFISENDVYLTEEVDKKYLSIEYLR